MEITDPFGTEIFKKKIFFNNTGSAISSDQVKGPQYPDPLHSFI